MQVSTHYISNENNISDEGGLTSVHTTLDLGLIFLSGMSHKIATSILNDHAASSVEGSGYDDDVVAVIVSTTIVLLGLATASLGGVLILAGKFRFADAVAYLPLPVVGGEPLYIDSLSNSDGLQSLPSFGFGFYKDIWPSLGIFASKQVWPYASAQ
jgi:hypothetical protein